VEKKISGISPGKTYVIRFRPSGSSEWSKGYEFNAPRPTTDAISTAARSAGTSKNRVSCRLQRTSGVIFNSTAEQAIPWNVVVSNEYGIWSPGSPTQVVAPVDGWYDIYTSVIWLAAGLSVASEYPRTSIRINGVNRFSTYSTVTNNVTIYISSLSPPTIYINAGDIIEVEISPASLELLAYGAYSGMPPTELSVTYMGP
jgi:hypothetical protein